MEKGRYIKPEITLVHLDEDTIIYASGGGCPCDCHPVVGPCPDYVCNDNYCPLDADCPHKMPECSTKSNT